MTIDTSAIVAILLGEPEAERFARAIATDPIRVMSAVSWLETAIVLESRKGPMAVEALETFITDLHIDVLALDESQARRAFIAWRGYGKGRHPAGLNLGDVCTYAASAESGEPILLKGEDFSRTDCATSRGTPRDEKPKKEAY